MNDERNNCEKNGRRIYVLRSIITFLLLFAMVRVCIHLTYSLFKDFSEYKRYRATQAITAGIIEDKEIINGHKTGGGNVIVYNGKVGYGYNNIKNYIPTIYRIHISAEFKHKGETHQGSNYFDVSEDIYNSYNVGDYFDSKNLLGNSEDKT